jgi:lysophospholipase L1-like esterase
MTATNGSAVPTRKRGRVIGCIVMLALAVSALVIAPAAATATTTTYLALGDSISFGYTQEKFGVNFPNEAPAYFEEGSTNAFAKLLGSKTEVGKGVVTVNLACPGETSNGAIGENEGLGGQTSTEPATAKPQGPGDWHPCAYINVNGLPLHDSLSSSPGKAVSQVEAALSVLKKGSPAHAIDAISLNIGSNDELAAIEECKKEITEEFTKTFKAKQPKPPAPGEKTYQLTGNPETDPAVQKEAFEACIIGKSIYVTTPRIAENVVKIASALDNVGAYTGPIVVLGFYNPDTFVLPGSDALQSNTNGTVKAKLESSGLTNIHWADIFNKINVGSETSEQTKICKFTEMCNPNVQVPGGSPAGKDGDIHPTPAGYKLIGKVMNEAYLAPAIP